MRVLAILTAAIGLTACEVPPPTKAVPCIVLTPRTDALRRGLLLHPETPEAIGDPAADLILGTEKVCR